jgi:flap endonuclease-1
MGVVLTPIVTRRALALSDLRGRTLAVDGNAELYQFLALIRLRDGTPLQDPQGRITSHLSGLFYRVTRLIADHGAQLVFVFDGAPPALKARENARRRAVRQRFEQERVDALERGDTATAYAKATMTSRLTREMVDEARQLLKLLGIPSLQAPSEGEAQAAHMAATSPDVWAAASKDYDALLFGAPRLVRFLTISGREFLPSQGTFRPITPETLDLQQLLDGWGIDREGLVDLALLIGTDFTNGVKGIGPKKALKLVQQYGRIERMPDTIREELDPPEVIEEARRIYLTPEVTDVFYTRPHAPDRAGILDYLCDQRAFGRDRVEAALERAFGSGTVHPLLE